MVSLHNTKILIKSNEYFSVTKNSLKNQGVENQLADGIGLEPMHPNRDDRLAICCITTLPTIRRENINKQYI